MPISLKEIPGDPAVTGAIFDRTPNIAPGEVNKEAVFGTVERPGIVAYGYEARDAVVRGRSRPAAPPAAAVHSQAIAITNAGAALLEFSFDGVNVHGAVPAGARHVFGDRHEAGIAVRGVAAFVIEAW